MSPTTAHHVLADLDGRIDAVLDGGPTQVGVESTIVACLDGDTARLLRPGGVTREDIERVLGRRSSRGRRMAAHAPLAPGHAGLALCAARRVRLDATEIRAGEAALLFGQDEPAGLEPGAPRVNLSPAGDLAEAAANLFAALRALDATGATTSP